MKFLDAIQKIEESRGYQIDSKAYKLENSFIMMVENFGELEQFLRNVPIFNVEQKYNGDSRKFLINALRLFSNYLASSTAFVSHTRCFVKDIYGSAEKAFDGKYQEKIESDFKNDMLIQFMEDLRNFYQHYGILPVLISTRVHNDAFYSRINISKKLLLESGFDWKKGKKFIESTKDDDINVLQLSRDCINKTIFSWIMQQQAKYHSEDFKELKRLKNVAKKLYGEKK